MSERSSTGGAGPVRGSKPGRSPSTRRFGIAVLVAAGLLLAACGGSVEDTATTLPPTTVAPAAAPVPDELALGAEVTFRMPDDATSQRLTFEVPPGGVVTLAVEGAATNAAVASVAVGPTGQTVSRVDVDPGETAAPFRYVTSTDGGGTWALDIQSRSGDSVTLLVDAPVQADGGSPGDAGPNAADPKPIDTATELTGLLGDADNEDWYVIPLAGGDIVAVTVAVPPGDGTASVFGDLVYNGNQVASFSVNEGGEEYMRQIFAGDQTGETYLRVSGIGDYSFTVEAGPQTDGGSEGDAGGDLADAKDVGFGDVSGILGGDDAQDYYVANLPKDAVIVGTFTSSPEALGELRIELIHNGAKFTTASLNPGQSEEMTFAQVNGEGDQLYIRVASQGGEYTMTLEASTQPDGGDGTGDAQDEPGLAKQIAPDATFDGIINNTGSIDPRDFYTFTAAATGVLTLDVSVDARVGADTRIQVRDDANVKVADFSVGQGGSSTASIDVTEGTVYVMELTTPGQARYTVALR